MLAWSLLAAGLLGYGLCTLVTARAAYGVYRARIIEQEPLWHADADPVEVFENHDRSSAATAAFLFGLAWPVTVPGYCVRRCATFVITSHPPLTERDRERRAEHLQQRIHVLEESVRTPLEEQLRTTGKE